MALADSWTLARERNDTKKGGSSVYANVRGGKTIHSLLAEMDVATAVGIFKEMDHDGAAKILVSLECDDVARILAEMKVATAVRIVKEMDHEDVAKILVKMELVCRSHCHLAGTLMVSNPSGSPKMMRCPMQCRRTTKGSPALSPSGRRRRELGAWARANTGTAKKCNRRRH